MKKKIENEKLYLSWGDKKMTLDLAGVKPEIIVRLALHGAAELLRTRKDPEEAWKKIKEGPKIKPKYPLCVRAIASLDQTDPAEVMEMWKELDRKQKAEIMYKPAVQIRMQQLKVAQ